MATVKPFKGVRPPKAIIEKLACLPYDVMNTEEAAKMAAGKAESLLHITRAEIDCPAGTDIHSAATLKLRNNDRKNAEKVFRNFPHKYTHQPALQARAGILSAQFSTFARTASLSNDEILTFVREKVT